MTESRTADSNRMAAMAATAAFVASVTLVACLVFVLGIRTHPVGDDFCVASLCWAEPALWHRPGIIQFTGHFYMSWSGRWAAHWLQALLLSTTPLPAGYPWLVLMLIATQCLLLYFAIWELVIDVRWALFLSAVIASVYWANMPSPADMFRISIAVENQLSLILGSVLFALVLSRRPTDTKQSTRLATVAAAVLGFVTPAFHELAGGILVLALSVITATAVLSKSSLRKMWLIVWTTSAIGFLVVFLAPGNFVRMATMTNRGNYVTVIKESLVAIRYYVLPWCLDFKHWLLAVLLWFNPAVASLRTRLSGLSSFRAISGFLLVWISLIMIALGAAIWNLGSQPPGRTMDLIYGVFLIGWVALAFLVMRPHPSLSFHPVHRAAIRSAALFLLSVLVAASNNTVLSAGDILRGRSRLRDAELKHRFAILRSAGPNADVLLPPLSELANESVLGPDIISSRNPNFWANQCRSRYYGLASIRSLRSRNRKAASCR